MAVDSCSFSIGPSWPTLPPLAILHARLPLDKKTTASLPSPHLRFRNRPVQTAFAPLAQTLHRFLCPHGYCRPHQPSRARPIAPNCPLLDARHARASHCSELHPVLSVSGRPGDGGALQRLRPIAGRDLFALIRARFILLLQCCRRRRQGEHSRLSSVHHCQTCHPVRPYSRFHSRL